MKIKSAAAVSIVLLSVIVSVPSARAQTKPPIAGVERTTFGVYKALAQLAFEFDQKQDYANAAKVARILMLVWAGQEHDSQPKVDAWRTIDKAMDAFAKPIVASDHVPLNQAEVGAAYHRYLDELQKADEPLHY